MTRGPGTTVLLAHSSPFGKELTQRGGHLGDTVLNYVTMLSARCLSTDGPKSVSPLTLSYPDSPAKRDVVGGHRAGWNSGN